MMAFFLLMWLLNATTEEQRKGIADYFSPTVPIHKTSGGGEGAFGGESITSEKNLIQNGTGASDKVPTAHRQSIGKSGVIQNEEKVREAEDALTPSEKPEAGKSEEEKAKEKAEKEAKENKAKEDKKFEELRSVFLGTSGESTVAGRTTQTHPYACDR